ncbi:hypothetical protein A9Q79_00465 [Methylophaga sp. 42_25_T18]|nr:hypothetical protein A9Q79_00465 [Methylophaga sp. 42_25_T18]
MISVGKWAVSRFTDWLTREADLAPDAPSQTNFERLCDEIRPGDIILVEGRSRVSDIIKKITQSAWSHSVLYLGNYHQLDVAGIAPDEISHYATTPHTHLIIETLLGQGTIVTPLSKYRQEHLRICRPRNLTMNDRNNVIKNTFGKLGYQYNFRQLFDLARFLLPYSLVPGRWRSTLFQYHAGESTKTICSSMLAEAFTTVRFPILPIVEQTEGGGLRFYKRNLKLFTPKDFDYSPYFDIIKYPIIGLDEMATYRFLPWDEEGYECNEQGDCIIPMTEAGEKPPDK